MVQVSEIFTTESGSSRVQIIRAVLDSKKMTNIQQRIRFALQKGFSFSSYDLNVIGRTVDARKYISNLRRSGLDISDYEVTRDGKKFKHYFLNSK